MMRARIAFLALIIGFGNNENSAFAFSEQFLDDGTFLTASWYGVPHHGKKMANGEMFDMHDPTTAAHPYLPFGTTLLISNPANGREIEVVVRDRGPYISGRMLDLSKAAAEMLGFERKGITTLYVRQIPGM